MSAERQTAPHTFAENLLRLPRELRELVYAGIFSDLAPAPLEDVQISSACQALLAVGRHSMDPGFEPEILEAFYTYSTFSVKFLDHKDYACQFKSTTDTACPCSVQWALHPQYRQHIRNLIVYAQETDVAYAGNSLEMLERLHSDNHSRLDWEKLLTLPRLEKLTVKLQKRWNHHFSWASFSPVLSSLRERSPRLQISLTVSFDALLERYWSDPIWENYTEPGNVVEEPYDPMGFVDVTELLKAPSQEDYAYVKEHFPETWATPGPDILRGLLDETASQRRALALHYVVREPALLRVQIMEHYRAYKKMRNQEMNGDIEVLRK